MIFYLQGLSELEPADDRPNVGAGALGKPAVLAFRGTAYAGTHVPTRRHPGTHRFGSRARALTLGIGIA